MQYKIWLKPSAEQQFVYGNNILKSGLGRITESTPQYQGVIIYSMSDLPLVSDERMCMWRDFVCVNCDLLFVVAIVIAVYYSPKCTSLFTCIYQNVYDLDFFLLGSC